MMALLTIEERRRHNCDLLKEIQKPGSMKHSCIGKQIDPASRARGSEVELVYL